MLARTVSGTGADVSSFFATCLSLTQPSLQPVASILSGCCSKDGECHQILGDGATLCSRGGRAAPTVSALPSPTPRRIVPAAATWLVVLCTRAHSRRLCWLRVSLRGAAESAACTSAARDPPEDDINQCFSPGLWQLPCARSCVCALGNKLQRLLRCLWWWWGVLHPLPRGFWGRGEQMCPAPPGELEGREMLLMPQGWGLLPWHTPHPEA